MINRIIQVKPGQEADNDPSVGLARVGVADGGGKEYDEAPGGPVAGALDQGRQAPRQGDDGWRLGHDVGGHF